jgi:hypothetical protein
MSSVDQKAALAIVSERGTVKRDRATDQGNSVNHLLPDRLRENSLQSAWPISGIVEPPVTGRHAGMRDSAEL